VGVVGNRSSEWRRGRWRSTGGVVAVLKCRRRIFFAERVQNRAWWKTNRRGRRAVFVGVMGVVSIKCVNGHQAAWAWLWAWATTGARQTAIENRRGGEGV